MITKTYWGMMRKFSWTLLVLVGLSEESANEVKDEVADTSPEKKIIWEKDRKEMALIPAGSFEMGDSSNGVDDWMKDARPTHTVELDAFYMDVHEVTVGQFRKFVNQSGYNWYIPFPRQDEGARLLRFVGNRVPQKVAKYSLSDDYPMVYVSWNDATAYANWAGKRLPTEAEWEYAARGRLVGKKYSWGDDKGLARDYANYQGTDGKDKWRYTAPVGSFKPNGYGLYDMAGNVWEWSQDWYDSGQDQKVLLGGSWFYNTYYLRLANPTSYHPAIRTYRYGFRCVSGSK